MSLARPDAPADIRELTFGAHFVVWAFRALALGRNDNPVVARTFEDACSPVAEESRNAFIVFVRELQRLGRRRVRLAPPGCLTLTRDEQLILAVFSAAQEGAHDRLEAHLTWLMGGAPRPPLAAAAAVVAQALEFNGHVIPAPLVEPPRRQDESNEKTAPGWARSSAGEAAGGVG
ncbi:MAG: hypothetical protein IIZ63_10400 [Caulobacteraceae bacterium]|nr:hypothetical protein [Caulobacteraceae bacterium]